MALFAKRFRSVQTVHGFRKHALGGRMCSRRKLRVSLLDELHKNVEVHPVHVPAAQLVRTISAAGQLLLPVLDDAADDIDNLVVDSNHHVHTVSRRADDYGHQRRLRRLRT